MYSVLMQRPTDTDTDTDTSFSQDSTKCCPSSLFSDCSSMSSAKLRSVVFVAGYVLSLLGFVEINIFYSFQDIVS